MVAFTSSGWASMFHRPRQQTCVSFKWLPRYSKADQFKLHYAFAGTPIDVAGSDGNANDGNGWGGRNQSRRYGTQEPDPDPESRSLWQWYENMILKAPLLTKVITSAIITGISDLIAQLIAKEGPLDYRRLLALTVVGAILTAPLFHYFYNFLEATIPIGNGWINTIAQLGADQLLAAPLWLALFYPLTVIFEKGLTSSAGVEVMEKYSRDFLKSLYLTWVTFVPCQLISFTLLPAKFRVLVLNVVDLGYTAALSYIMHVPSSNKEGDPQ